MVGNVRLPVLDHVVRLRRRHVEEVREDGALSSSSSVVEFIAVEIAFESNCERLGRSTEDVSHDRRECRRIDTAAQQDADGDIRDALSIDRGRQACGQFLDDFVLGNPIQVETRWVV